MEISLEELKEKEIINLSNGKNLGQISDIVVDLKKNLILGFIIEGNKKLFKKSDEIYISLSQILTVGDDVVLIRLNESSKYQKSKTIHEIDLKYKKSTTNPSVKRSITFPTAPETSSTAHTNNG